MKYALIGNSDNHEVTQLVFLGLLEKPDDEAEIMELAQKHSGDALNALQDCGYTRIEGKDAIEASVEALGLDVLAEFAEPVALYNENENGPQSFMVVRL